MLGTFLFYLLWPLVWFYAPLTIRVRVLLRYKDEVLVVKNWFGPNSWQLPGGGKKRQESVIETAIREINEELSFTLEPSRCRQLTSKPIVKSRSGLLMRYHFVEVRLKSKPDISISNEISSYSWVEANDVLSLIPSSNI